MRATLVQAIPLTFSLIYRLQVNAYPLFVNETRYTIHLL